MAEKNQKQNCNKKIGAKFNNANYGNKKNTIKENDRQKKNKDTP